LTLPSVPSSSLANDPSTTLIVTRPASDAGSLIDALRARGRRVVALPVIAIEPTDDPATLARTLARVDDYRLVVFVSPNAIRQALAHRTGPWPVDTAIGVMGPGSVETLKQLGIAAPDHRVVSPTATDPSGAGDRFDSEALFAALDGLMGLARAFDGRVLILRGNGGRAWFADRLRALGIAVDEVEAYRRVLPTADAVARDALKALVASNDKAVFVVTSSEGIANLTTIVGEAVSHDSSVSVDHAVAWMHACRIVAPHRRIAEKAREAGFSDVSLCAPGDRGILAAIE
jgi:uroporphyrinogen III methyltransferase/synthase